MYGIRRSDGGGWLAATIRPTRAEDKLLWAATWVPAFPPDAEDAAWDWPTLIDLALAWPARFACYSLLADNDLQGLRLLEVAEDEVIAFGTHAMRLSTAPWNRPPERRFEGVGSLLVACAIERSHRDGHRGQIHCSSLCGAEAFHEQNGMVRFDDLDVEGLARYRFTDAAASAFLDRLRSEGYLR